jgi:hypothetical protein
MNILNDKACLDGNCLIVCLLLVLTTFIVMEIIDKFEKLTSKHRIMIQFRYLSNMDNRFTN